MASVRHHVQVAASADHVWRVVGRPELVHLWFPGIVSCVVEGDVRTVVTGNGLSIPELIVGNDALLRRFQYRITSPMFRAHLATVDVLALEPATGAAPQSVVVYATDADPAVMALVIGGGTLGALHELRRQFAAGAGAALTAAGLGTSPRDSELVHG